MQARKNKYQRDKRGHIIEEPKEKEDNKGKGKFKEEAVMSKNKFEALEVEEDAQPILTITDGNVDGKDKNERKDQGGKGTNKVQQQENKKKEIDQSPNPTPNGTRGGDSRKPSEIPSQTYDDAGQLEDGNEVSSRKMLWSDEVEVMEAKMRSKVPTKGKENRGNMQLQKTVKLDDVTVNPSSSTARVEDRGTSMEDQVNVSAGGDHGKHIDAGKQRSSHTAPLAKDQANGTVKSGFPGEILGYVDGVTVYALMKERVGNVPKDFVKDKVCQNQQTHNGKGSYLNGTVTQAVSASFAIVNPNLSSVYELQYKMMQEKLGDMVSNSDQYEAALTPHEPGEQAIVSGESEALPIACSSGIRSPLPIKVNVPLKSPNQVLHDLITHQGLPLDIQNSLGEQQQ
ncbi:hypothetical protein A4A49_18837 [Nicotiana attenuata]|uniref:Uncharacterized protein n=1 Tax=Nicotiana attenuata TaxID=49451 RepID=A0A1J6IIP1_NICAT|nr:hypothetical protein A4A49_18837 [Nicotiana attenuata]